jgi:hypothetical protein
MKFLLPILFILSLGVYVNAQASEPGTIAQALKRSINLDDDMTDWEGLPVYAVNLSNSETPEAVSEQGYFSVAWDEQHLYLLGVFTQSQANLITGLAEDAEEWWNADTLEVFVRLEPDTILHYATSPDGTGFLNFLTDNAYETYSSISEEGWSLQLAFPLASNALAAAQTGESWEFKVGHGNPSAKEYSLWPLGGDFLGEDNFGLLYFTEQIESESIISDKLKQP